MLSPVAIERLKVREYWTPGECALLYPHGADFFRGLFDSGAVAGYVTTQANGRMRRYLNASSVRAHFRRLEMDVAQPVAVALPKNTVSMRDLLNADPRIQAIRAGSG